MNLKEINDGQRMLKMIACFFSDLGLRLFGFGLEYPSLEGGFDELREFYHI